MLYDEESSSTNPMTFLSRGYKVKSRIKRFGKRFPLPPQRFDCETQNKKRMNQNKHQSEYRITMEY